MDCQRQAEELAKYHDIVSEDGSFGEEVLMVYIPVLVQSEFV
jgi:hypothetical protein